ncbi:hypothetical protein ABI59_08625 [Acidobacteria bacterium Mor1]|nr:hypothetical protein ABI59_08625 [Acidobacteria bacterium Mor1]
MGLILILAVFLATIYVVIKSNMAFSWHNRGVGERKGRAAYGRLQRTAPESPDAQMSEAEFVERFVSSKPGVGRYILYAGLLLFVGMPVSCFVAMSGG